jgi:outer membrane protein TolC
MANTAICLKLFQTLDIQHHLTAQIPFYLIVTLNNLTNAVDLGLRQVLGTFLPSVTPVARYDYRRLDAGGLVSKTDEGSTEIDVSWRILDAGQRNLTYRSRQRLRDRQGASTKQILRNILFTVNQQFYDALRTQELVKVRDASVERANEIMKSTEAQIAANVAPAKDILQARADLLNAKVDQLDARNQDTVARAQLKATIGFEGKGHPELAKPAAPEQMPGLDPLDVVIRNGLAAREDLRAQRFGIEAQRLSVALAQKNAGVTWALDANYTRQFTNRESDSRNLTFLASMPLFDGNQSKEAVTQARLGLAGLEADYEQAAREAAAEIESAYRTLEQDRERFAAATAALEAARENYKAATEAQRLGADGTTIITVLTAKISLITAESNYVNAVYDVFVSEVRLKLAAGQPIPGE